MKKTLHFCTLFDSNYLTRGMALYLSLIDTCPDFVLYVIAFDQKCYEILSTLKLEKMVVISLAEFEDSELLRIKLTRTRQEYCWTCSSSSIFYCIKKYNLDRCTYLDADLLFFSDPQVLFDEMGGKSILLTEHRLPEVGRKITEHGKYCVQFMPFKNDGDGMRALTWWKNQCLEWCYARIEDGKIGDQGYLNEMAVRFPGVHVLEHIGGGVAPWNMFRYKIFFQDGHFKIVERATNKKDFLIFYHFQNTKLYRIFGGVKAYYGLYEVRLRHATGKIYVHYEKYIDKALKIIRAVDPDFSLGFNTTQNFIQFNFKISRKETEQLLRRAVKKVRKLTLNR